MVIVSIHGLETGDTYRYLNDGVYSNIAVAVDDSVVAVDIPVDALDIAYIRASRLGFSAQLQAVEGDNDTFDYNPIFTVISGVVYDRSTGLSVDDYLGEQNNNVVVKQQMYDDTLDKDENIRQNLGLWVEFAHTIPDVILNNVLPLIAGYENYSLNINYSTDVVNMKKTISGVTASYEAIQYATNIQAQSAMFRIEAPSLGVVRILMPLKLLTGGVITSPLGILNYLSGIHNDTNIVTNIVPIVKRNANGSFVYQGLIDRRATPFTIETDNPNQQYIITVRDTRNLPIAGITDFTGDYFIGGRVASAVPLDATRSTYPVVSETGRTVDVGYINCNITPHAGGSPASDMVFTMRMDRYNALVDNAGQQLINAIADGRGQLSARTLQFMNQPDAEGKITYAESAAFEILTFNTFAAPDANHISAVVEIQRDAPQIDNKLVALSASSEYTVEYDERVPIRVYVPILHNGQRASNYLVFVDNETGASGDTALLEYIKDIVVKNNNVLDAVVKGNLERVVIDTLTNAIVTVVNNFVTRYVGFRFDVDEDTILDEVSTRVYVNSVDSRIVMSIHKLIDNNTLGEQLYTGAFLFTVDHDKVCNFIIPDGLKLVSGKYVIGFNEDDFTHEIRGDYYTISDNIAETSNVVSWDKDSTSVSTIADHYGAFILKIRVPSQLGLLDVKSGVDANTGKIDTNTEKIDLNTGKLNTVIGTVDGSDIKLQKLLGAIENSTYGLNALRVLIEAVPNADKTAIAEAVLALMEATGSKLSDVYGATFGNIVFSGNGKSVDILYDGVIIATFDGIAVSSYSALDWAGGRTKV